MAEAHTAPDKATIRDRLKKWIKALRSNKYSQCKGTLHNGVGYCCLGVAAVVLGPEMGAHLETTDGGDIDVNHTNHRLFVTYRKQTAKTLLPCRLGHEIGLTEDDQDRLAEANDEGASFLDIADDIEANILSHYL